MGGILNALRGFGDRASFEADRFMRTNRVKSDIGKLKKQIEGKYAEVGHTIIEMKRAGTSRIDFAEIERRSDEIAELERELKLKEAEILAVQNEKWEETPEFMEMQGRQQEQVSGGQVVSGQGYTLPAAGQGQAASYPQSSGYNTPPNYPQAGTSYPTASGQALPMSSVQTIPPQPMAPQPQSTAVQPQPQPEPQAESFSEPPTQKMDAPHCAVCGAGLRPGARFCQSCGTAMKAD